MKLGAGSSSHFTVALVLFPNTAHADECQTRIQELRTEMGMKTGGKSAEFHFCKASSDRRETFLRAVASFPFHFYTSTIVKEKLSGRDWLKKDYMYQRAGVLTLDQALGEMVDAKLLFDATSSKAFDWEFLRFLKKHAGLREGVPVIKEVKRLDSHKADLIQLVDMVCGAVMAEDDRYYRLILHREGGRVNFP